MKNYLHAFSNLCYPSSCLGCQQPLAAQEELVCLNCLLDLPLTHFHKRLSNPVTGAFTGRVPILRGTAYLFFQQGGVVQQLLHLLKYKNRPEVGVFLGGYAASTLKAGSFFRTVDAVVPVPLHPAKEAQRGYNQALKIAQGLADELGLPVAPLLLRESASESQTRKGRYDRYLNVNTIFSLLENEAAEWEGKHLVVVDDVLTTGATLEGCLLALQGIPEVKLSVFTLAYAP